VSALVGRHPLKERYYRDMRNAIAAALVLHAGVFAIAPPYRPKPFRMKADFIRLVDAVIPTLDNGAAPAAPAGIGPVAPPRERVVADLPVRTSSAAAELPSSSPAPSATASGQGKGTAGVAGVGEADEAPPVFYSYDRPPQVTRRVKPEYPAAARDMGAEGTVVVNMNIDERGHILRAWVAAASANEILINAALDAAYEFEFAPGLQRDIPVKCTVAIPFQFTLRRTLQVTEEK
jgi:protein TonB